ncbi:N,N-dimethylformamidase beta subunit family domain-containing protein [Flavitalea sp.]|nr:N,N-dimethylformamidase beta subunit family domain-containing protein [Flavitalea sp.]
MARKFREITAGIILLMVFNIASAQRSAIVLENQKEGTTDWLITNVKKRECEYPDNQWCRRPAVEGYVSHQSILAGEKLKIFVSTNPVSEFKMDIYRLGYYGGKGGRKMLSVGKLKGVTQAEPKPDPVTNLFECGWKESYSFTIPKDWMSGVYIGKITTLKDSSQTYVIFIVKDKRKVDFLFQCSDMTWLAYNRWPYWNSLYDLEHKAWNNKPGTIVSFNRPYGIFINNLPSDFNPYSLGAGEFLLWEYPLSYWMEKEGYDVSYISNTDTHADGEGLNRAKGFLSVGHDEYWSQEMFDNLIKARDKGLNLLFFSGNSISGRLPLTPSVDGTPNKVMGPKTMFKNEEELMGSTSYGVGYAPFVCKVPDHWLFEGTGMKMNDTIPDLIGWEYHGYPLKNDPSLVVLATSDSFNASCCHGDSRKPYAVTIYDGPKNNIVFNAASCFWSMPLAKTPSYQNPVNNSGSLVYKEIDFAKGDERVRQMTKNLFKRVLKGGEKK